eukprot:85075-Chlamydomonas_euryale.AAC.2
MALDPSSQKLHELGVSVAAAPTALDPGHTTDVYCANAVARHTGAHGIEAPHLAGAHGTEAGHLAGARRFLPRLPGISITHSHIHSHTPPHTSPPRTGYYKGQPKPELARVVWDTKARTSTPPVILSHRAMVGGEASDMPKQGFTVKAALLDWCIAFKAGNVPPYLGDWAAC